MTLKSFDEYEGEWVSIDIAWSIKEQSKQLQLFLKMELEEYNWM